MSAQRRWLSDFIVNAPDVERARTTARRLLPEDGFREALDTISAWSGYAATPLVSLPGLAEHLGVGAISLKDESDRFGLGSFKALGGAHAVYRLAQNHEVRELTVTCSTDGNHGRSVAWAAGKLGCRCVIYVHAGVSARRVAAIRELGAQVVQVGRTYDESVALNARDARRMAWHVVADTDPDGRSSIVLEIMQGYRVLAEEALGQLAAEPTHLFLQVGCGGFAASVVAHMLSRVKSPPRIVAVEPKAAACLAESVSNGRSVRVDGDLETLMAGLSVGQVSLPAWDILRDAVDAVIVVADEAATVAMRLLAAGTGGDITLISGESGAAGVAGLLATTGNSAVRGALGLDRDSHVLVVSTEGATDPVLYEQIVGELRHSPSIRTEGNDNDDDH